MLACIIPCVEKMDKQLAMNALLNALKAGELKMNLKGVPCPTFKYVLFVIPSSYFLKLWRRILITGGVEAKKIQFPRMERQDFLNWIQNTINKKKKVVLIIPCSHDKPVVYFSNLIFVTYLTFNI